MKTSPPITPEAFNALIENRKIYIFGANVEGIGLLKLFLRKGLNVIGFIDSRIFPGDAKRGMPVISPEDFLVSEDKENVFIIVATKHRETRRGAIEFCKRFGLGRGSTFLTTTDLCEYLPTIEVAGSCNLRCISCDMGLPGANRNKGLMSIETFRKVIEKMTREIPFMNSVCLFLWGEPLIHPDLPEIVRTASEFGLATEISTNLNNSRHLERLIEAGPDVIVIPCSGIGENYEMTHTAGNWEIFRENLIKLKEYIDKYQTDVMVRIYYHLYKHNLGRDYEEVEALAKELGFQFAPILANIFPGKILRHVVHDEPIPDEMLRASELAIFKINDQIEYAKSVKHKPCPAMKAFPTVRWDTTVMQCCNLTDPSVGTNYLDMPLTELVKIRDGNGFCETCQEHGMHRYFETNISIKMVDGQRIVVRK